MTIQIVQSSELSIVQSLAKAIWPTAYSTILSEKQLQYMLETFYGLEALRIQKEQKNQVFLLIKKEDKYVGFCSYELHADDSKSKTKLHKIYVLPETHGKGYGRALLDKVIQIAKENKDRALYLNVNRFNNAKDFYLKEGFSVQYEENIDIGNGYLMEDYVMEKNIL